MIMFINMFLLSKIMTDIKICIDKIFPERDPYKGNMPLYDVEKNENSEMAVEKDKRWQKEKLKVKFLNGDLAIQDKVKRFAKEWELYANIKFEFTDSEDADIRIAFKWFNPQTQRYETGSWSLIGTDAEYYTNSGEIAKDEPTMNFGWLELDTPDKEYSRVVLHEFGHALGAIHEHQHPAEGIPWNKEAIYKWHEENSDWTREMVDHNYFERYNKNIMNFTEFDNNSIMLYPIPPEFTLNNKPYGGYPDRNRQLSKTDKDFIGKQYPK